MRAPACRAVVGRHATLPNAELAARIGNSRPTGAVQLLTIAQSVSKATHKVRSREGGPCRIIDGSTVTPRGPSEVGRAERPVLNMN